MVADDSGMMTTELVLIAPLLIVSFVAVMLLAGRSADAQLHLQTTAQRAARAATLAGGGSSAISEANRVASSNLDALGAPCVGGGARVVVEVVDVAGVPVDFAPGNYVHVEVACTVRLSDLGMSAIPGEMEIRRDALELIDVYRSGTP